MGREKRRERDTGPATTSEPSAAEEPAPAAGETSTPEEPAGAGEPTGPEEPASAVGEAAPQEPAPDEPREVAAPAGGEALEGLSDRQAEALERAMDDVDERQGQVESSEEAAGDSEWGAEDRDALFGLLGLVEEDVRKVAREEIDGWTEEQCSLAAHYAGALLDRASDHDDGELPPMPAFLRPRRFWTTWNEEHRIGCGIAFHTEAQARAHEDDRRLRIKPFRQGVAERDVVPVDGPEDLVRYACLLPPGESFGS